MENNYDNTTWDEWLKSAKESVAANMKAINDFKEAHGTSDPKEFADFVLSTKLADGTFTQTDIPLVGDLSWVSDKDLSLLEEVIDNSINEHERLFQIDRIYKKIFRLRVMSSALSDLRKEVL